MERLIEYAGNHPWLVAAAIFTALIVIVFELRARQQDFAAISPQEAIRLMREIGRVDVAHVRREQNKEADALANEAMDNHRG